MSTDKYLTPKELSERFKGRITVKTLQMWRWQMKGPAYRKIGGRVLYEVSAVEAWEDLQDSGGMRCNA